MLFQWRRTPAVRRIGSQTPELHLLTPVLSCIYLYGRVSATYKWPLACRHGRMKAATPSKWCFFLIIDVRMVQSSLYEWFMCKWGHMRVVSLESKKQTTVSASSWRTSISNTKPLVTSRNYARCSLLWSRHKIASCVVWTAQWLWESCSLNKV